MMEIAEWHQPFVADLPPKCPWLGEAKVMCLARSSSANQAGKRGDEGAMRFIAEPSRRRKR